MKTRETTPQPVTALPREERHRRVVSLAHNAAPGMFHRSLRADGYLRCSVCGQRLHGGGR